MIHTRRSVLKFGGVLLGAAATGVIAFPGRATARVRKDAVPASASGAGFAEAGPGAVKRLSLYNLHTDESLEFAFFKDGAYVPESLAAVEVLLRDFRNDERHPIEPTLLDDLYEVARRAGVDPVFKVISGYRSPQTNAMLHERSPGVASHSLHMQGRAIDVRLAHVDCAQLARHALAMGRGGVGYYRRSDFVHIDNGAVRTWRG